MKRDLIGLYGWIILSLGMGIIIVVAQPPELTRVEKEAERYEAFSEQFNMAPEKLTAYYVQAVFNTNGMSPQLKQEAIIAFLMLRHTTSNNDTNIYASMQRNPRSYRLLMEAVNGMIGEDQARIVNEYNAAVSRRASVQAILDEPLTDDEITSPTVEVTP